MHLPVILAADLVPWWFAGAFWIALIALLAMVVRDVRRMGGPRRVLGAVREAIDRFGDEPRGGDRDQVSDGNQANPGQ